MTAPRIHSSIDDSGAFSRKKNSSRNVLLQSRTQQQDQSVTAHKRRHFGASLVLVLPADIYQTCYDFPLSAQRFRLYFLCEVNSNGMGYPRHIRLSDHPGYDLDRPLEFPHCIGHHALTMLEMVKYDFSSSDYKVPAFSSGQMLHFNYGVVYHWPAIKTLVGRTITVIQQLSLAGSDALLLRTRDMLDIKFYITPQNRHILAGQIYRYDETLGCLAVRWISDDLVDHKYEIGTIIPSTVQYGDIFDSQKGTITLKLYSLVCAMSLCFALLESKHAFGCNVTLWSATQMELEYLVKDFSQCNIRTLQIDGVTCTMLPQGRNGNQGDFFLSLIQRGNRAALAAQLPSKFGTVHLSDNAICDPLVFWWIPLKSYQGWIGQHSMEP